MGATWWPLDALCTTKSGESDLYVPQKFGPRPELKFGVISIDSWGTSEKWTAAQFSGIHTGLTRYFLSLSPAFVAISLPPFHFHAGAS